ncbi:MAG: hypothetical protein AABW45_01235, partial [Nanoarchaeota archaeon]
MLNINKKILIILIVLLLSIKFSSALTCPANADTINEFKSVTTQMVFDFLGDKTTLTSEEVSIIYDFYNDNKNNWNSNICTQQVTDILNRYFQITSTPTQKVISLCSSDIDCNDNNRCTVDRCSNPGEISSSCSQNIISSCTSGDGCCPGGCGTIDNDCSIGVCGNNLKETGETCSSCPQDVACAQNEVCSNGQCTTVSCSAGTCNDDNSCTIDSCTNPGTVTSQCNYTNKALNSVCLTNSGSGGICDNSSPKKICLIPICSSSANCNDNNACTLDSCTNPGKYNAACSISSTITSCVNNDGCCPAGCN